MSTLFQFICSKVFLMIWLSVICSDVLDLMFWLLMFCFLTFWLSTLWLLTFWLLMFWLLMFCLLTFWLLTFWLSMLRPPLFSFVGIGQKVSVLDVSVNGFTDKSGQGFWNDILDFKFFFYKLSFSARKIILDKLMISLPFFIKILVKRLKEK